MTVGTTMTFEEVQAEFGARVRGAVRQAVQPTDAPDVEQECWISIHSALRTYRGEASLGSYIYPIVRRRIADYHRWSGREARLMNAAKERLSEKPAEPDPLWTGGLITAAELRVLRELSAGATNDQVAGNLCISKHTVRSHMKELYRKTGARNRTVLVLLAYRFFKEAS